MATNPSVDVHVLAHSAPQKELEQCLASLKKHPQANVKIVHGHFGGSVGKARAYAFQHGRAKYVSFVDDDDYLLDGGIKACVDYLEANPDKVGVYTDYYRLKDGHSRLHKQPDYTPGNFLAHPYSILHLKVMRREHVKCALKELKRWSTLEEFVLCCILCNKGDWGHIPEAYYVKREKDNGAGSKITRQMLRAATLKFAPYVLGREKWCGC